MATMECPRCVAERKASQVRSATGAVIALAFAFGFGIPCVFGGCAVDDEDANRIQNLSALVSLGWVPLACVALVLHTVAGRFARRAAKPLPVPAVALLTHYREGAPSECPQHPFARKRWMHA